MRTGKISGDSVNENCIISFRIGSQAGTITCEGKCSGKMTYTIDGKEETNNWTGDYTFTMSFENDKLKITETKGPDANTDGWYAIIPATIDANNIITFNAKDVPYLEKNGSEYAKGSFKGPWNKTGLSFTHVTNESQGGIWSFTGKPLDPTCAPNCIPEPGTLTLLSLGLAGLAGSRRRELNSE